MNADEIQKLRKEKGLSLSEARQLIERKYLFKEVDEIQKLEDVKNVLKKILHQIF
jgi:predicted AAA+ superfamily ATPase